MSMWLSHGLDRTLLPFCACPCHAFAFLVRPARSSPPSLSRYAGRNGLSATRESYPPTLATFDARYGNEPTSSRENTAVLSLVLFPLSGLPQSSPFPEPALSWCAGLLRSFDPFTSLDSVPLTALSCDGVLSALFGTVSWMLPMEVYLSPHREKTSQSYTAHHSKEDKQDSDETALHSDKSPRHMLNRVGSHSSRGSAGRKEEGCYRQQLRPSAYVSTSPLEYSVSLSASISPCIVETAVLHACDQEELPHVSAFPQAMHTPTQNGCEL